MSSTKQAGRPCASPGCFGVSCSRDGVCVRCRGAYRVRLRDRPPLGPHQGCERPPSSGYRAAHKRVQRARGKASAHRCHWCIDRRAAEWAYDRSDRAEIVGRTERGIAARWSVDTSRYLAMCKPCHRLFDRLPARRFPQPGTPWTPRQHCLL